MRPQPLLLIELNEVNFDLVARYVSAGHLPTFGKLLARHGASRTTSESRYEEIEPWIQWVTAHTGLTYAEHGVFRLGDIVDTEHDQIWERLERRGLKVGAVSPMNAKHRLNEPAFFLPDPWTDTAITAGPLVRRLHGAIRQAVNDNADARLTAASALWLALGLVRYAAPSNYLAYARLLAGARASWRRAAILDLLLGDLFCHLVNRSRPHFASLFLNAAAHVQHHYFHSSTVADTGEANPAWYCAAKDDPVLEIYQTYDRILATILSKAPAHRLMIATGLTQVAHERPEFYWRLKDHDAFLRELGVEGATASPRMSRDFVAAFTTEEAAARAATALTSVRDSDGEALFDVDNRGRDLFVTLAYSKDIPADFVFNAGNRPIRGLRDKVVFVAIKNGRHDGRGYLIDSEAPARETPIPLSELPDRIVAAFA